MSLAIRFMAEPVRLLGFAAITNVYAGIMTALARPARMIIIQNTTDVLMMFSFNGVDDHIPITANGYMVLDIASNKTISQGFFIPEGTRFYVKHNGIAPTVGSFYVSVFFGSEQ
jgi:hypothetical protein